MRLSSSSRRASSSFAWLRGARRDESRVKELIERADGVLELRDLKH
jgi:hypothetical protein